MQLIPLKNQLLVKEIEETPKAGSIILMTPKEKNYFTALVLDTGSLVEEIAVGDTIIFGRFSGHKLDFENEEYFLLAEKDVMAIVR